MATTSEKNFALSPAAFDLGLGLGDRLSAQADEIEAERKKKLARMNLNGSFNPATADLFGLNA